MSIQRNGDLESTSQSQYKNESSANADVLVRQLNLMGFNTGDIEEEYLTNLKFLVNIASTQGDSHAFHRDSTSRVGLYKKRLLRSSTMSDEFIGASTTQSSTSSHPSSGSKTKHPAATSRPTSYKLIKQMTMPATEEHRADDEKQRRKSAPNTAIDPPLFKRLHTYDQRRKSSSSSVDELSPLQKPTKLVQITPKNVEPIHNRAVDSVAQKYKKPLVKRSFSMQVGSIKTDQEGPVALNSDMCFSCEKRVYIVDRQRVGRNIYHRECIRCLTCKRLLGPGDYFLDDTSIYCRAHYNAHMRRTGYSSFRPRQSSLTEMGH